MSVDTGGYGSMLPCVLSVLRPLTLQAPVPSLLKLVQVLELGVAQALAVQQPRVSTHCLYCL